MSFDAKTVVVTGGASGIGAALVAQFRNAGARVAVVDLMADRDAADEWVCHVADGSAITQTIGEIEDRVGPIDIFVSNAGVLGAQSGGVDTVPDDVWARCWHVNVMAHVHAARALVPLMEARGGGHFVNVVSAAGLLNQIGDAAYSATKHAAVSFAESLAIAHGDNGIKVTLVCPQYVATPLIELSESAAKEYESLLTAQEVATAVLDAVADGRFLVLPHPAVRGFTQSRAKDHDQWIAGMQTLRRALNERPDIAGPMELYKLL
ncbi:MAG: SDR family NAD(P)-dependent oxidoreductase [Pseudomonadota bacterium]